MVARTFNNQLRIGSEGERMFIRYLIDERGVPTGYIKDVRKDKTYQALDVDFIVKTKRGKQIKVEVKTNNYTHETGKMPWEMAKRSGAKGLHERSAADYMFYYLPATGDKYLIDLPRARECVHKMHNLELRTIHDGNLYFVPIQTLIDEGIMLHL